MGTELGKKQRTKALFASGLDYQDFVIDSNGRNSAG